MANPPSDATYLIQDGSLDGWESVDSGSLDWTEQNGYIETQPGASGIRTTEAGDAQLHLEWRIPDYKESHAGTSGSSVLLMDLYRLQLLDPDGAEINLEEWAGAYPDQEQPRVNELREPDEWQSLDSHGKCRDSKRGSNGRMYGLARWFVLQTLNATGTAVAGLTASADVHDEEDEPRGGSDAGGLPSKCADDPVERHPANYRFFWFLHLTTPGPSHTALTRYRVRMARESDRCPGDSEGTRMRV
jgi:hypothetical protein